jgi:phosphatidylglycerol:prolipoprotein diacylglycerol transferase
VEETVHPILIKLGPLTIASYGFLFALGVLLGVLLCFRLAKKEGLDLVVVADFLFWVMILSLLGAKLWLLVTNLGYYLKFPGELKYLLTSGGTFYGGLIFGAVFAVWFIRRHRLSYRQLGDIAAPALALGHFFGRLGCFAAGCCWGREAAHCAAAVTFTDLKANSLTGVPLYLPLYPTQLMEAALNLANFLFLIVLYGKRRFRGQVLALYILNYSLIRFVVEFFRGDPDRGYVIGGMDRPWTSLSLPQLVSLIGFVAALLLLRGFKRKGERENRAAGR